MAKKAKQDELTELRFEVLKHYGVTHQIVKLAEEAAELAQAAAVLANDQTGENLNHVREEFCDVYNVAVQVIALDADGFEAAEFKPKEVCLAKMRREIERIKAREAQKDD